MENFAVGISPALLAIMLIRFLGKPIKWGLRFAARIALGLLLVFLWNSLPFFQAQQIPINNVTMLTMGLFGIPGTALLAALEFLP